MSPSTEIHIEYMDGTISNYSGHTIREYESSFAFVVDDFSTGEKRVVHIPFANVRVWWKVRY